MIGQIANTTASGALVFSRSGSIEIRVGARLELDLDCLPMSLIEELREANRFRNPRYSEAKKRGYWVSEIDKYIKTYRIEDDVLHLPKEQGRSFISGPGHSGPGA